MSTTENVIAGADKFAPPLRIVELRASNVKRIKAVTVRPDPDGNLVVVSGRNGQGKSSLLDSIAMALGGKDQVPAQPVRNGEDSAEIVVDLGDIVVTRRINSGGSTRLTVANKEGAKFSSPQKMLDELVGRLTFDPLAFSRMKPKEQAETLRALLRLDFTAQLAERQRLYEERTVVNREVAACDRRLADLPARRDDLPPKASVSELLAKIEEGEKVNLRNGSVRADADDARLTLTELDEKLEELKREVERIQDMRVKQAEVVVQCVAAAADLVDVDLAPLRQQIQDAEEINRAHADNEYRETVEKAAFESARLSEVLTAEIENIDADRRAAIAEAKMPVDGLGFDQDGGVTLNGLPLEQASAAEQLRVSVAIGVAMNPRLRVLLIRDASLLDSESMQLVADLAAQSGSQLWVERIEEDASTTVVIEGGEVREGGE